MRLMNNTTMNCKASTSQQKDETNNNNNISETTDDQLNLSQLITNQQQQKQQQNLLLEVLSANPALANAAIDYPETLINAAAAAVAAAATTNNNEGNAELGKSQMQDMADMLINMGFSPDLFNQLIMSNPPSTTNQQQQWELSHSLSHESLQDESALLKSPTHKTSVVSTTKQQEQQQNNNNNNFMNQLNLLQLFSTDLMNSTGIGNNTQAQQLFMAAAAEALQTLQSNGNTDMALAALNSLNNNTNSNGGSGGNSTSNWDFNALAALLSNTNEQFGYLSSPSKVNILKT